MHIDPICPNCGSVGQIVGVWKREETEGVRLRVNDSGQIRIGYDNDICETDIYFDCYRCTACGFEITGCAEEDVIQKIYPQAQMAELDIPDIQTILGE